MDLVLRTQECFKSEEGYEELLKAIPDSRLVETLRTKWESKPGRSSEDKWSDCFKNMSTQKVCPLLLHLVPCLSPETISKNLMTALEDIIIQYTYPRLDAEVSKHRNHLLKAPFCVHPSTGRVCVPLDLEMIENFDPKSVPTVLQLLGELDAIRVTEDQNMELHSGNCCKIYFSWSNTPSEDWEKTSLKPYINILEKHASGLMQEVRKEKLKSGSNYLITP